jgi:hypothetical protein
VMLNTSPGASLPHRAGERIPLNLAPEVYIRRFVSEIHERLAFGKSPYQRIALDSGRIYTAAMKTPHRRGSSCRESSRETRSPRFVTQKIP